jgi:hypothetical protein
MSKRYWFVFISTQLLGILWSSYALSVQVGVGKWHELVWIPATLLRFPGMLIAYAAGALDISPWLGKSYSSMLLVVPLWHVWCGRGGAPQSMLASPTCTQ